MVPVLFHMEDVWSIGVPVFFSIFGVMRAIVWQSTSTYLYHVIIYCGIFSTKYKVREEAGI